MSLTETTLSSEVLLQGIVFRVDRQEVRLGDGSHSKRDIVRHAGGVGVLARTPRGTWLLVRQFRKALDREVLEMVAGMREPGESAEQSARRELEEETGYTAKSMIPLGESFASPGYTDEIVTLFYAETDAVPGGNRLDHDERVLVEELDDTEMRRRMSANEIRDSKTVVAWFLAAQKGLC
ncbi:MAG: NUDIX hydrolase [Verrucomicrobia bacterium]|nr:NUDIX hydrolase [Verrucomicrobiota bacterium]MCH8526538.1 NUDIX hydrolase [Kiritimatiellia bacterium]